MLLISLITLFYICILLSKYFQSVMFCERYVHFVGKYFCYTENDFYNVLNLLNGSSFLIDDKSCSIYFENLILSKFRNCM